ncbi:mitochondrial import inner membrane translocase subunit Tim9-like isoform X3 [Tupaia chinensis]|uniref:mitochondrial import inner membrane translocase subunit Tim9-like isoform X3 n=1 Tax=Tupaia chinensis TaxID=246437 RepID=UPI0007046597|nr:mitochondrial import inner membrane translocase subunit Tim9-like isoform X3 [Tupaia chinensis]
MAAQIPESDQIKPFREYLRTFNKLTETCFLDCVKDFTTKEVKPEEITSLATKAGLLGQPR